MSRLFLRVVILFINIFNFYYKGTICKYKFKYSWNAGKRAMIFLV